MSDEIRPPTIDFSGADTSPGYRSSRRSDDDTDPPQANGNGSGGHPFSCHDRPAHHRISEHDRSLEKLRASLDGADGREGLTQRFARAESVLASVDVGQRAVAAEVHALSQSMAATRQALAERGQPAHVWFSLSVLFLAGAAVCAVLVYRRLTGG